MIRYPGLTPARRVSWWNRQTFLIRPRRMRCRVRKIRFYGILAVLFPQHPEYCCCANLLGVCIGLYSVNAPIRQTSGDFFTFLPAQQPRALRAIVAGPLLKGLTSGFCTCSPVALFYVVYPDEGSQIRPFVFTLPHQAADCPCGLPQGSAHHPG